MLITSLNLPIIYWSLSKNKALEQISMFRIESCAKKLISSDYMSQKRQSHLRWQWAEAWKWSLAWFWINHNQILQPNQLQMKDYVWMRCRDLHWLDEFHPFLSSQLLKTIFYSVIDQPSKTWSKQSSVLSLLRLVTCTNQLDEHQEKKNAVTWPLLAQGRVSTLP